MFGGTAPSKHNNCKHNINEEKRTKSIHRRPTEEAVETKNNFGIFGKGIIWWISSKEALDPGVNVVLPLTPTTVVVYSIKYKINNFVVLWLFF